MKTSDQRTCGIDIETYSSVSLADAGVYAYTEAPDFDILLIGYKLWNEDEVHVIDTLAIDRDTDEELRALRRILEDPGIIKTAFNANFERTCLAKWLGVPMPPEQWQDTMVKALTLGLPGSLAGAGMALGLPEEKLKDRQGTALISFFCKPCKPTRTNGMRTRNFPAHDPKKWKLFIEYNRQDVVSEQEILQRLSVYKVPESEQLLWDLDQHMNDHGVRLDVPMIRKIVEYDAVRSRELQDEARAITGLANPNSLAQLKEWLETRGAGMESVTKDSVAAALKTELPDDVRRVLRIRTALGKTSVKKYKAMLNAVCEDGRLRGILQFYGAGRTGRWAGRLVQIHNLAKNFLPDLDLARELASEGDFETLQLLFGETAFVFSELLRTAFIPSEGCRFVASDFSAIEARVVAWLAGEEWVLRAFLAGKDIYCETASQMYHVPVEKHGQNAELRQKGKIATLACGYGGGVGAMKAMDRSGTIPEEELRSVVYQWRQANPRIVKLWRRCENAARIAIEEKRTVHATKLISFSRQDGHLFVSLPSGRSLCYWRARINDAGQLVYMGTNQKTRQWTETETWGGKLVENIVQAVARDCIAVAMQRVTARDLQIVMHVHDEMIVDVPESRLPEKVLDVVNAEMSREIEWAPGLPLKGDGYVCNYYKKE